MKEKADDAITYVRHFGRPDLFITFTCSPDWIEIKRDIGENFMYYHRHDIVARIFNEKIKILMDLLIKKELFGPVVAYMYTVEWQKRGLPHIHLLLWLKDKVTGNNIDKIVSAEIPNPLEDKELFDIVIKYMVHGPCGGNSRCPCMQNNKCTKKFPKPFSNATIHGEKLDTIYSNTTWDNC